MADEAPTLYPEPIEAHAPPGRGRHGYWRRREDDGPASGWIVIASTSPSNRADSEYKGSRFLPQYGEFTNGCTSFAREPFKISASLPLPILR